MPHRLSISLAAASLALTLAPQISHADARADRLTALRQDAEGGAWADCMTSAYFLPRDPDAKITDDTTIAALTKPVGGLAVGATPTVKALAAECLAQAKQDPNKTRVWTDLLWLRAGSVLADAKTMQQHPDDMGYATVATQAAACAPYVDLAAQVLGADATVTLGDWTGTVGAARSEICDKAVAAAQAMKAKKLAPFVAAGIKSDRLKILDDYNVSVEIGVPGGTFTLDPKRLAKANPWFSESTGDDCGGGRVITHVHRYQFDKDQKLTKESTKDYCGAVPKSAYR